MPIFNKINRETGDIELRYILFEGNEDDLHNDIVNFHFIGCDLYDYDYEVRVKSFNGITYVAITYTYDRENILDFCTHINIGEALMPFYFVCYCEEEECIGDCEYQEIRWDKSRTYTPEQMEEAFPSDKYDTVEVK